MRMRKRLSDRGVMRRVVLREVEVERKKEEEDVVDERELTCLDSRAASLEHRPL